MVGRGVGNVCDIARQIRMTRLHLLLESRREGSQRADLSADTLVTYFLLHPPLGPQGIEMPERAVTIVEAPVLDAQPHRAFIEALQLR